MTKDERETIRERARPEWRRFYPADKGKGNNIGIICPICKNGSGDTGDGIKENPHSKSKGNLTCFKCGFNGDILDLIQKAEHTDYNGALEIAANVLGAAVTTNYNTPPTRAAATEAAAEAAEPPADYREYYKKCVENLKNSRAAQEYIEEKRRIPLYYAYKYMIGYDPEWQSPTAIKKGATPPASARIILPCSKSQYEARTIESGGKTAKMNEGGKGLFNKGALWNIRNTEKGHFIFITEGIFDALSVISVGGEAVALNGTGNAKKLLEELKTNRPCAILILSLDNDKAGQDTTKILESGLQELNITYSKGNICGEYNDPNEALIANRKNFETLVGKSIEAAKCKPDTSADYINQVMQRDIDIFASSKDKVTGFAYLDYKAGGLYSGLYVIAAISSLGKTTFAAQVADQLAAAGEDVIFFSLEMSRLEMVTKSLARRAHIINAATVSNSLAFRRGEFTDERNRAAADYISKVGDRISVVEGNFECNIDFVDKYIENYIFRTGKRPTIFIDYLQILANQSAANGNGTREAVDLCVTELKRMSRKYDITIFAVCSVNRANYLTPIDFESLKESGGIEYTADVIWGLQLACLSTDSAFDSAANQKIKEKREKIRLAKAANPRKIELVCLKNRYGIANFSAYFDYYPAHDFFAEDKQSNGSSADTDSLKARASGKKPI